MNFKKLASKIIPGYDLLSKKQQDEFEATESGQLFVQVINELLVNLNTNNTAPSYFSYAYSVISSLMSADYEQEKEKIKDDCLRKATNLINTIKNSEEYKELISLIIFKFLEEHFLDFSVLTTNQQLKLSQASFSNTLQSRFLALNQERNETHDSFLSAGLIAQQEEVYQHWLQTFNSEAEMAPLRERIALIKVQKRVRKLAKLFPLLNEITEFPNPSAAEELVELYCEEDKKDNPDLATMEEGFLATIVFRYYQKISAKHINFINLKDFNQTEAKSFARDIIRAANDKEDPRVNLLLASYGHSLRLHLRQGRLLINNKSLEVQKNNQETGFLNSLSYLFQHSKALNKTNEFLKKYGDAHAIIQYTGFSTQNESSYLGLLDVYNYNRSADNVAEAKTIFTSLIQPFISLYEEYKDIALYEKNGFRKFIRMLMPLLIIAGVIILIGAMLSPLAIPEFAFLIAAIPAVLIGIYLASKYVTWKNEIYLYVYQNWLNDGPFEIPEYQVNARMIKIFGNEDNALLIRSIYIEEIKLCDELEQSFSEAEIGGTEEEIELRRENIKKRHTLCLEWYDIHSNLELGYNLAPKIAEGRLIKILNEEIVQLEQDCQDSEDLKEIDTLIDDIVNELKTTFAPQKNNGNDVLLQVAESDNANRFFKPKSIEHQQKAESIDLVLTMIRH
ncbi:MAG: hypothetical protein H0T84_06265 [Tatlockia sp.]|nr:hypothetical protein [Tatlockia sp.]